MNGGRLYKGLCVVVMEGAWREHKKGTEGSKHWFGERVGETKEALKRKYRKKGLKDVYLKRVKERHIHHEEGKGQDPSLSLSPIPIRAERVCPS